MIDLAALRIKVNTSDLEKAAREVGNIERPAQRATAATAGLEQGFMRLAKAVAAYLTVAAAIQQTSRVIMAFADYERQMFRLESQITATGRAGQTTAKDLEDMAQRIARATLQSTSGVRDAQAILMSFRNVSTKDFERILNIAADVAEVMRTDIVSAATQMAKALEDPERGMGALSRTGTTFDENQKKWIKTLQESGKALEAQSYMLSIISGQYGGAAANAAKGLKGDFDSLTQSIENLYNAMGSKLAPETSKIVKGLTVWIDVNQDLIATKVDEFVKGVAEAFRIVWPAIEAVWNIAGLLLSVWLKLVEIQIQVVKSVGEVAQKFNEIWKSMQPPDVRAGGVQYVDEESDRLRALNYHIGEAIRERDLLSKDLAIVQEKIDIAMQGKTSKGGTLSGDVQQRVLANLSKMYDEIQGKIEGFNRKISDLNSGINTITNDWSNAFDDLWSGMPEPLKKVSAALSGVTNELFDNKDAVESAEKLYASLRKELQSYTLTAGEQIELWYVETAAVLLAAGANEQYMDTLKAVTALRKANELIKEGHGDSRDERVRREKEYHAVLKITQEEGKEAERRRIASIEAHKNMLEQMGIFDETYFSIRRELLDLEHAEYLDKIGDKLAVQEWYNRELERLEKDRALASGDAIEGMKVAVKELAREWEKFAKSGGQVAFDGMVKAAQGASREIQSTLSTVIFDGLSGQMKSFEDYWNGLWDRLKQVVFQAVAEMIAKLAMIQLAKAIGGSGGILGTIGSVIGGLAGGGSDAGGLAGTLTSLYQTGSSAYKGLDYAKSLYSWYQGIGSGGSGGTLGAASYVKDAASTAGGVVGSIGGGGGTMGSATYIKDGAGHFAGSGSSTGVGYGTAGAAVAAGFLHYLSTRQQQGDMGAAGQGLVVGGAAYAGAAVGSAAATGAGYGSVAGPIGAVVGAIVATAVSLAFKNQALKMHDYKTFPTVATGEEWESGLDTGDWRPRPNVGEKFIREYLVNDVWLSEQEYKTLRREVEGFGGDTTGETLNVEAVRKVVEKVADIYEIGTSGIFIGFQVANGGAGFTDAAFGQSLADYFTDMFGVIENATGMALEDAWAQKKNDGYRHLTEFGLGFDMDQLQTAGIDNMVFTFAKEVGHVYARAIGASQQYMKDGFGDFVSDELIEELKMPESDQAAFKEALRTWVISGALVDDDFFQELAMSDESKTALQEALQTWMPDTAWFDDKFLKDIAFKNEDGKAIEDAAQTWIRAVDALSVVPDSIRKMNQIMQEGLTAAEAFGKIEAEIEDVRAMIMKAVDAAMQDAMQSGSWDNFGTMVAIGLENQILSGIAEAAASTMINQFMSGAIETIFAIPMEGVVDALLDGTMSMEFFRMALSTGMDEIEGKARILGEALGIVFAEVDSLRTGRETTLRPPPQIQMQQAYSAPAHSSGQNNTDQTLNERRQLEIREMELQGKSLEALTARRAIEIENADASNREILVRIHALENEAAALERLSAFETWQQSLDGLSDLDREMQKYGATLEDVAAMVEWASGASLEDFEDKIQSLGGTSEYWQAIISEGAARVRQEADATKAALEAWASEFASWQQQMTGGDDIKAFWESFFPGADMMGLDPAVIREWVGSLDADGVEFERIARSFGKSGPEFTAILGGIVGSVEAYNARLAGIQQQALGLTSDSFQSNVKAQEKADLYAVADIMREATGLQGMQNDAFLNGLMEALATDAGATIDAIAAATGLSREVIEPYIRPMMDIWQSIRSESKESSAKSHDYSRQMVSYLRGLSGEAQQATIQDLLNTMNGLTNQLTETEKLQVKDLQRQIAGVDFRVPDAYEAVEWGTGPKYKQPGGGSYIMSDLPSLKDFAGGEEGLRDFFANAFSNMGSQGSLYGEWEIGGKHKKGRDDVFVTNDEFDTWFDSLIRGWTGSLGYLEQNLDISIEDMYRLGDAMAEIESVGSLLNTDGSFNVENFQEIYDILRDLSAEDLADLYGDEAASHLQEMINLWERFGEEGTDVIEDMRSRFEDWQNNLNGLTWLDLFDFGDQSMGSWVEWAKVVDYEDFKVMAKSMGVTFEELMQVIDTADAHLKQRRTTGLNLLGQLAGLEGNDEAAQDVLLAQRALELEAMDEALVPLQRRVWALQDLEKAESEGVRELESFRDSIDSMIQSIKYSNLNVALPGMKTQVAAQDYDELMQRAMGEDATIADKKKASDFAKTYLGLAQSTFKSSSEYQDIYAQVMGDLETLGMDAQSSIEELQLDTLNEMMNLDMEWYSEQIDLLMGIKSALLGGTEEEKAFYKWMQTHGAADYYEYVEGYRPEGYSAGGIASGPLSGYPATLHGTEAIIPLPNGRSIPVHIQSADGYSAQNERPLHIVVQVGNEEFDAYVDQRADSVRVKAERRSGNMYARRAA